MDKAAGSRPLSQDIAQAAREIAVILEKNESPRNAKLPSAVADLTYRGLRHWGLAQVRAKRLASKLPSTEILAVLAIAWAALREQLRADHVVVDEAVAATKFLVGDRQGRNQGAQNKLAGFVNALLRKTLSDPASANRDLEDPVARWNAPIWWIQKIQADYGKQAPAVLDALAHRGSLTLRLSPAAPAMADYMALLETSGFQGVQVGPHAVVIRPASAVERIPGFSAGQVSVQDASAQWAAEIFSELKPTNVLDACAAPGGKSVAMAQHLSATIWAMDQSTPRLERLARDLPRVQQTLMGTIKTIQADVLKPSGWPAGLPAFFDAILLDAPCSASGVTRRHPEIAWRRDPQAIAHVVDIQRRMLDILWRRLKPGGELVFVTCSVFSEEGEEQQRAFLERTPDAQLMPSPGRCLPMANLAEGQDQDGFFFAKFKKRLGTDDATSSNSAVVAGHADVTSPGQ